MTPITTLSPTPMGVAASQASFSAGLAITAVAKVIAE
jgi:hypothetical protein